jgi:hypothetical protein
MLCAEVSAARAEADPADAVVTLRDAEVKRRSHSVVGEWGGPPVFCWYNGCGCGTGQDV